MDEEHLPERALEEYLAGAIKQFRERTGSSCGVGLDVEFRREFLAHRRQHKYLRMLDESADHATTVLYPLFKRRDPDHALDLMRPDPDRPWLTRGAAMADAQERKASHARFVARLKTHIVEPLAAGRRAEPVSSLCICGALKHSHYDTYCRECEPKYPRHP